MTLSKEQERDLQLAEFLSTFQAFYEADHSIRKGPISVSDIEIADSYRHQLHNHYALENELRSLRRNGKLSPTQLEQWETAIKESIEKLGSTTPAVEEVYRILRRFEVWSTRALAQHVLMHCSTVRHHSPQEAAIISCGAPLLNLPGAQYFADKLPSLMKQQDSNNQTSHSCSLPLTPNSWTAAEFARICSMVCLLPGDKARAEAHASPLTCASPCVGPLKNKNTKEDLKLSTNSLLTQADLVALWVRAQRNTGALYHLLQLFHISEAPPEEEDEEDDEQVHFRIKAGGRGGKELVPEEEKGDEEKEQENDVEEPRRDAPRFIARFIGNHKNTRNSVVRSSKHVDSLVEWAVTNQFLFTNPFIRKTIAKEVVEKTVPESSKRVATGANEDEPPSKRQRHSKINRESSAEDRYVCEAYILNWFARRNRDIVAVLFSKAPQRSMLPFYQKSVESLVTKGIVNSVKERLEAKNNSSDRFFARIYRRTLIGVFEDGDESARFREAVTQLLEALEYCITTTVNADERLKLKVQAARSDFDELCETFLKEEDTAALIEALVDLDDETEQAPADVLKAVPAPWMDKCLQCQKGLDSGDFYVCNYCEVAFHTKCDSQIQRTKLREVVVSCKPLAQLYSIKQPYGQMPPDYRDENIDLQWKLVEIDVYRETDVHGRLPALGLKVRQTEACEKDLDELLSGSMSAASFSSEVDCPLAVNVRGAIVVDVMDDSEFVGRSAGICTGDVIVQVRCGDSAWQKFDSLSENERMKLLGKGVRKMTLRVQRCSVNVVSLSRRWFRRLRKANKTLIHPFEAVDQHISLCPRCQDRNSPDIDTDSIRKEATWCRAVIRRLGMESFSRPFHDEEPRDESQAMDTGGVDGVPRLHSDFVSLRRLDGMMTSIIARRTRPELLDSVSLSRPFMPPPWAKEANAGERLEWVTPELEHRPMELLCKGIELILSGPNCCQQKSRVRDMYSEERCMLSSQFLVLFSAWCLRVGNSAQMGPPLHALSARAPWIVQSCSVCEARQKKNSTATPALPYSCACDSLSCQQIETSDPLESVIASNSGHTAASCRGDLYSPDINELLHSHSFHDQNLPLTSVDSKLHNHDRCASLVGTTLLILPGDLLLEKMAKELNCSIDHGDRAMMMVVASYLPSEFAEEESLVPGGRDYDQGIFHILPVINPFQLEFLLKSRAFRRSPVLESGSSECWTKLNVLGLKGVVRMREAQLRMKILETQAIRNSIDRTVARYAGCASSIEVERVRAEETPLINIPISSDLLPCQDIIQLATSENVHQSELATALSVKSKVDPYFDFAGSVFRSSLPQMPPDLRCLLLENMLACETPYIREMINALNGPDDLSVADANDLRELDGIDTDIDISDGEDSGDSRRKKHRTRQLLRDVNADQYAPLLKDSSLQGLYALVYTDLMTGTIQGTEAMHATMRNQRLKLPTPVSPHFSNHTFVLERDNSTSVDEQDKGQNPTTPRYRGNGWGFEFVLWKNDKTVRIGRVHPNSPASKAGIQMHDILFYINGFALKQLNRPALMVSGVLGLSDTSLSASIGLSYLDASISVLRNLPSPACGPIVVRAGRLNPTQVISPRQPVTEASVNPAEPRSIDLTSDEGDSVSQSVRPGCNSTMPIQPRRTDAARPVPNPLSGERQPLIGRSESQAESRTTDLTSDVGDSAPRGVRPSRDIAIPLQSRRAGVAIDDRNRGHGGAIPMQPRHADFAIHDPPGGQGPVTVANLYVPGLPTTVLTCVETAVLNEAILRQSPLLGCRLLVPRYSWQLARTLERAVDACIRSNPHQLLRLSEPLWTFILRADYERSLNETGGYLFVENNCGFHLPSAPLPLDRLAEDFFHQNALHRASAAEVSSEENDTRDDRFIERIRGGGGTSPTPGCSLSDLPTPEWHNQFVWGNCETTKDGNSLGQAYFLGRVGPVNANPTESEVEKIDVQIFYVSNHGHLPKPMWQIFEASDMNLIGKDDSEKATIAETWAKQETGMPAADPPSSVRDPDVSEKRTAISSDPVAVAISEAGRSLVERLCRRKRRAVPLGVLPDGRAVIWFQSDPAALYIRCSYDDDGIYTESLRSHAQRIFSEEGARSGARDIEEKDQHYCVWGCSNLSGPDMLSLASSNNRVIPFATEADLISHLAEAHGFSFAVKGFTRINEGEKIRALSADLTSAICARYPKLVECTAKISRISGDDQQRESLAGYLISLLPEKVLDLSKEGRGTPRKLKPPLSDLRGSKTNLMTLLRLWSRIARLFDVQSSGHFRLSPESCLGQMSSRPISASSEIDACMLETCSNGAYGLQGLECKLCCAGFTNSSALAGQQGVGRNVLPGRMGCSLFRVCFPEVGTNTRVSTIQTGSGYLGAATAALVQLSSVIPKSLKLDASKQLLDPDQPCDILWDEDNHMSWRTQVEASVNVRSLAQAYVILLRSLNKSRLPPWWRGSKCGWDSPVVILNLSSFQAFFLHLFVFDLALAEYSFSTNAEVKVTNNAPDIPEELLKLPIEQRMATVIKWAEELGYDRFTGESGDSCIQCGDGGDLLCCEFCKNVQHASCCRPPIIDSSNFDWVCDPCTNDFAAIKL